MGKEDRDWYRGRHPAACTCVRCEERRRQRYYKKPNLITRLLQKLGFR